MRVHLHFSSEWDEELNCFYSSSPFAADTQHLSGADENRDDDSSRSWPSDVLRIRRNRFEKEIPDVFKCYGLLKAPGITQIYFEAKNREIEYFLAFFFREILSISR